MKIKNYKDLLVWQKSMDLVEKVYKILNTLPTEEKYCLQEQMKRSVISIPSNIAEGQQRYYYKDFIRFLLISKGSCAELETQLLICIRLNYVKLEEVQEIIDLNIEIIKMLSKMIISLNKN